MHSNEDETSHQIQAAAGGGDDAGGGDSNQQHFNEIGFAGDISDNDHPHHPFEVQCSVGTPTRGSYASSSVDRKERKRPESKRVRHSFDQGELGALMGETSDASAGRAMFGFNDLQDIEEQLPSRLAVQDGTRTISFRRRSRRFSRSRSRRRSLKLTRKGEVQDESSEGVLKIEVEGEDVMDSGLRPEEEIDEETVVEDLSSIKLHAATMEKKRRLRNELLQKMAEQQEGEGYNKWFTKASKELRKHRRYATAQLSQSVEIWNTSFKEIEGTFGASVLSYFTFVRLLFFVNLFMALLILLTLIIPQTLIFSFNFLETTCNGVNVSSEGKDKDQFLDQACNFSRSYRNHILADQGNASYRDHVIDFFLGEGWMEYSVLFFGFYSDEGLSVKRYDMALSYLLTTGFYLASVLMFMVIYSGKGLKERMIRGKNQPLHVFERVFCGWDYSLCQLTSAKERHKTIFQELEMIYENWRKRQEWENMTFVDRCKLYGIRIGINLFVISLLVGAAAAIVMVVIRSPQLYDSVDQNQVLTLLVSFLPSLVLTVANLILPVVFRNIVVFEKYSDETQLQISLLRTVFLRLASIAVLIVTIAMQIDNCSTPPCAIPHSTIKIFCWETYVGQQLYRLVILDFVIVLLYVFFYDYPLKFLLRRFPNNCLLRVIAPRDFDVPQNVIDITYTQALCWIGAFFSPLIPAITALKMIIFFFVKKVTLLHNYKPKPYRASGTTYFFMLILMVAFVLCSAAIAYAIARFPPSKSCGPFRVHADEGYIMFSALTVAIQSLPKEAQIFFSVVGSWIFYLAVVIVLCMLILWNCLRAYAHEELIRFSKDQLKIECADKEFLLKRVRAMREAQLLTKLQS